MFRRGLGLMGRAGWTNWDGLVLEHCNSVHTFFMRMSIDILFLDRDGVVIKTAENVPPWRLGPIAFGAATVVELPAGTIRRTSTTRGDVIAIEDDAETPRSA